MSFDSDDASTSPPVFSIIVPLEFHRGQWERCWKGWNDQTIARLMYETILVVPPGFRQQALLNEFSADRVEFSEHSHDIALCHAGAAKAQGKYLIFTEAHCWPEPDVLEKCLQAIRDNPDWAGFSCRSVPITHNRLSKAEAAMYMADIEYAMHDHPWRRILDQCFVTKRDAYESCGGFRPELGHFAEWVLAASYFRHGYKLGYFPEARFHHYYTGSLGELREFTLDFVAGEISYFNGHPAASDSLLEPPLEWMCQGNFDRDTARSILEIAVKSLWPPPRPFARHFQHSIGTIARWIVPAIFGDWIARGIAEAHVVWAHIGLLLARATGSESTLNSRFKSYIATLIAAQRRTVIGKLRRTGRQRQDAVEDVVGASHDVFAPGHTGFYPIEQHQGHQFRWSDTAAAMLISVSAGTRQIRINCLPVRDLTNPACDLRFYLDGARIPPGQLRTEEQRVSIDLNAATPRVLTLGWTCVPLLAPADSRRLGLAIKGLELT
jgi:hypothetical protein